MRILLVNYRYFISGGPEKYMFNIKKMLEDNGHEVIPFSIHSNKNVETEYSKYFVEPIGSRLFGMITFQILHWSLFSIQSRLLQAISEVQMELSSLK